MEKLKTTLMELFPAIDFDKEKHLYSDGILDSFAMVEIVSVLADEFGVYLSMEYLVPENFESIESIWKMVQDLK